LDFGDPLGVPLVVPKRGKDTSRTYVYHHAKYHDNWLHCRRDICPQTQKSHSRFNIQPY